MGWYEKMKTTTTLKQRLLLGAIGLIYIASAVAGVYIFMFS